MKRFLCIFLTVVLCLGLAACGAEQTPPTETEAVLNEAVTKVIALIDDLGEVTLDSLSAIEKAEKAYKALRKDNKALVSNFQTLEAARSAYTDLLYESQLPGEWFWPDGAYLADGSVGANIILETGGKGQSREFSMDGSTYESIGWSVKDGLLVLTMDVNTTSFRIVEENGYLCLEDVDPSSERIFLKDLFLQVDLDQVDVNDYLAWTTVSFCKYGETSDGTALPLTGRTLALENLLYDQGWMFFMTMQDFMLEFSYPAHKTYYCTVRVDGSKSSTSLPVEAGTGAFYASPFGNSSADLDILSTFTGGKTDDQSRVVTTSLTADQLAFTQVSGKLIYINSAYVKSVTTDESGRWRVLIPCYDSSQAYPVGSAFPNHEY